MFRSVLVAGAVAAWSASSALAVSLDLGLGAHTPTTQLSFAVGGYTMTVSAVTTDAAGNQTGTALIGQYGKYKHGANQGGIGVTNAAGDAHEIDGSGAAKDMLILTFDKPVKLISASFSLVDSNDNASFFVGGAGSPLLGVLNLAAHPTLVMLDAIGKVFGFSAADNNDNYKLRSIEISAIPVPPAAALLGTGLLGLLWTRRRRLR